MQYLKSQSFVVSTLKTNTFNMLTEQNDTLQVQKAPKKRSSWSKLFDHLPKFSFSEEEIVKVLVGNDKTPFQVHKSVLTQIPYFAALLDWNKSQTEAVEVNLVEPEEFRIAIHWAYTHSLLPGVKEFPEHNGGACWYEFLPTVIAYKCADQLMMSSLQNALVDNAIDHLHITGRVADFGDVALVCEHGLSHTPLYQLFLKVAIATYVGCHNSECDHTKTLDTLDEYPQALRDALKLSAAYHKEPWDKHPTDKTEFHIEEVDTARWSKL